MKPIWIWFVLLLVLGAAGCSNQSINNNSESLSTKTVPTKDSNTQVQASPTIAPQKSPTSYPKDAISSPQTSISSQNLTSTPAPGKLPTKTGSPVTNSTPDPNSWQQMPVIPTISANAHRIYQRGIEMGSNPHAFSKVGDCGSTPSWFLGDFDRGPKYYSLGDYQYLSAVIQQYAGSFGRTSLAAKSGFNASSVFATLWADRSQCKANETPLACEYRLNKPSIALITLGTNDVWHQDVFETKMRAIINDSIQSGVLPVLATKADNDEGDGSINATIVRLANEYDIPLWNYWRAVQSLPEKGLQPDGAHITWGPNRFDDPQAMKSGWAVRNLTALQTLDAVWKGVTGQSDHQP